MKKFFLLEFIILIPLALSGSLLIDYNSISTVPKVIGQNTTAVIYLTLVNGNMNSYLEDIDLKFTAPNCITLENKEVKIDSIAPGSKYVLPVYIKTGACNYNIYSLQIGAEYSEGGNSKQDSFSVPVVITEVPKVNLEKVIPEEIEDDKYYLSIYLKNIGSLRVKDVSLYIFDSPCANVIYKNYYYFGDLDRGEKGLIKVPVKVLDYKNKICSMPVVLYYEDWLGNIYSKNLTLTFLLPSKETSIDLDFVRYDLKDRELEFTVVNNNNIELKNVIVKILESRGFSTNEKIYFIGDLDPYDYGTFSVPVENLENGTLKVKFEVEYIANEKEYSITKESNIKIYIAKERNYWIYGIAGLFILVIGYLVFRKLKKKGETF